MVEQSVAGKVKKPRIFFLQILLQKIKINLVKGRLVDNTTTTTTTRRHLLNYFNFFS